MPDGGAYWHLKDIPAFQLYQLPCAMPEDRLVFNYGERVVYNCHTFHSAKYIRSVWGQFGEIESIVPLAHGGYQDVVVIRK